QERLKQIAQLLKEEQLDIVVLNEVDFCSFWSGHVNQARLIAEEAGYPYRVEQRNVDVAVPFFSLRFGNVILSKYPIIEAVFLDYPHSSAFEEALHGGLKEGVVATLALPDGSRIQVAAVHLSLEGETIRRASVQQILDVQRRSSLPMIAMGDFNSTASGLPAHYTDVAGHNAIDTLRANGQLTTLWPEMPVAQKALTFPSKKPGKIIDWIFVSPDWQIETKTVISSDLSDHLPVTAVLAKAK
ncbi:MAG: endonuclease/exonuclease/phosphatase family protein, partial [Planctomycetota bacterium]